MIRRPFKKRLPRLTDREMDERVLGDHTNLMLADKEANRRMSKSENDMVDLLDRKAVIEAVADEWIGTFKRVKGERNTDLILAEASPFAAMTQFGLLLHGSEQAKFKASEAILNRVKGKPIERRMNLDVDLSGAELDEELRRLINRLTKEGMDVAAELGRSSEAKAIGVSKGEGEEMEEWGVKEVSPEPDAEEGFKE